jgi:thiol:disulfide interchange protein
MGAAVGFAVAQPALVAFAVFTSLALGLALPYVLLSWHPGWARMLPRPGAWMEVLKQLTAVPLFATVIWLTWVYGQKFSPEESVTQIAFLLGAFLILAISGWTLMQELAENPLTADIPVIVVTGVDPTPELPHALLVLPKPCEPDQLATIVADHLPVSDN